MADLTTQEADEELLLELEDILSRPELDGRVDRSPLPDPKAVPEGMDWFS